MSGEWISPLNRSTAHINGTRLNLLHRELAIQNMSPINMLKDSQTFSQAALSDLRPAYTLFLNEFQDYQTVKFDFGHKIGAIDLQ